MKTSKVLSAFPYYGGKSRMSPLICSLLDYDNTNIYIEPYGGGCRTLLSKPKHDCEMYNDFSHGLCTFMEVMSNEEKTEELIFMLNEEPPNREKFEEQVFMRMEHEDRLNTMTNEKLKRLAHRSYIKHGLKIFRDLKRSIIAENYKEIVEYLDEITNKLLFMEFMDADEAEQYMKLKERYKNFWELIEEEYTETLKVVEQSFEIEWEKKFGTDKKGIQALYKNSREDFIKTTMQDMVHSYTDDILTSIEWEEGIRDVDIAYMIFQLYYCSRDGMGVAWGDEKNRNIKSYYKAVANLRNVSQRLRDVHISQVDAMFLVEQYRKCKNVMMYLDPSYLKPDYTSKNLGKVYKMSYGYEEHKRLLEVITKKDTEAKILISNYDADIYNEYLFDWDKRYYKTYTSVGGRQGNRRLEVLWKNY